MDPAISIIKNKLEQDRELKQPWPFIISPHFWCSGSEHIFPPPGTYYGQVQGAAMGSNTSPIMANHLGIGTTGSQSILWRRYVDDTFVIQRTEHRNQFLQHSTPLGLIYRSYRRTWHIYTLLDTPITPAPDKKLSTPFFGNPTHTDQYLHWDSHHNLSAKCSVYNILIHRARTLCQAVVAAEGGMAYCWGP